MAKATVKAAPRELTPIEQADLQVTIDQHEFDYAAKHITEKATEVIQRLQYAIRDILSAQNQVELTKQDGEAHGASPDAIDKELAKRLGYLAQQTTDAVISQVGNMNLGYIARDLVEVERKRAALVEARAERAKLAE